MNHKDTGRKSTAIHIYNPEEFISKAEDKNDSDKYDYSQVDYINNRTNVKIVCKKHGIFEQAPNSHLTGKGCSMCSYRISKPERQWLEYMGIPDTKENRQVILYINDEHYKLDGYVTETNTVYEFHGDYWHGNPKTFKSDDVNAHNKKTFGQLYEETLARESHIKEFGYNLVVMWVTKTGKLPIRDRVERHLPKHRQYT